MPEIKNTFLSGKMNKDLDDRLLPEGEYRDAQNIEVLKPDGENVGVIQNAAGNTIAHTTLGLSTDIDVIGTYFDEKNKRIYWFVTDNNDLYANDWYIDSGVTQPRSHAIYYYDADPSSATYETAKAIVTGRFLKFSKKYKITGIAMIDDLLFWTDNKNQPRRINVAKAIGDTDFYNNELKISLAKYAPYTPVVFMTDNDIAGTSTMSNDAALNNDYIQEEFVRFSYRYKFNDNEYSVLAPFTQIAFQHSYKTGSDYGIFGEESEIKAYESSELDGMVNNINKIILGIELPSINPNGDFEIKEVEIIIKESDSTVARIVETKTLTDASITSTFYTYTYNSDTPQETLPEDQITRVFDNVPTKAKALDIVGNRLVFGNYSQNTTVPTLDYNVSYGAKGTQTFTGDGSDTTFTLTLKSPTKGSSSIAPTNTNQFIIYINDVLLASTNYAYDGTTGVITFNSAPANGAAITVVLANHEYPDSSLKQRRTYQVGIVLADIFGRQSPVILPSTASNSIITVPARTTASEFNSWVGDNLKITFNAQSGKLIPDDDVYSNELDSGIYATYNPYGWYSYRVVVKQLEQEYYNVYTPGAAVVDNNSYITLFGDNINKVPRLMETVSGDSSIARSDTILYPKVVNTSFYTTTTTTEGKRSAETGGTTTTTDAMVYSCNQYMIFNRHASSAKSFKYLACDSTVTSSSTLTSSLTTVSLGARKKQYVWSMTFPDLTQVADIGFLEITQLTFNKVHDSDSYYGFGEVTDASSGQIAKTISFDTKKRIQALSSGDEISIVGIGKLSDFASIKINTIQEYKRSSSVYDDAGGPFYQRESNHLIAQLPPYSISSSISNAYGVRMLFTDDTGSDNTSLPALNVTSYIKRGKAIDLAVFETKPIESEINIYYETSTSGLINELNALETGVFSSSDVTVSNFAVAQNGTITAPTINVGSLQSVVYVNATTDSSQTVGYDYFVVSANTTRTAQLTITAPNGYTNAGQNIIISATATQALTSGATTVPLFSDLSLTSTASTSSSAATFTVSATISATGGAAVSEKGFKIGTTNVYANATGVEVGDGGTGAYTTTKSDATINTLYYVWAYATNSVGTAIQGPIQVTTPALGLFQVSDWTGSISVNAAGTVTEVDGNSPDVDWEGATISANSSTTETVSVTLGQATGTVTTYDADNNTIRIQIPTSGYSNSASTAYIYDAVRTVTQPAAAASVAYTIALHGQPSGFSIAADAEFTQGSIATGTLNSVALSGSALTDGASTNLATVTNATLRALTLNITPGGSFTNSTAADFTYNIVQPSILPTLTLGSIPTQSTEITGSTDIDLRNYFTNGKFFEITDNTPTTSLVTASIVNGYILRLTGQGSCNDITGTTSAGNIVVAAYNEKATVDGSIAGSTASTSVVEKGSVFVSATVDLEVTACAQNATLTMTNTGNSLAEGVSVDVSSRTLTYATSDIGNSFSGQMVFTYTHASVNLSAATNISIISENHPFTLVTAEGSGNAITVSFSGTYPNQAVGGNINYSFAVNVNTTYVSANDAYFVKGVSGAGYTVSPTYINTGFGSTGAQFGTGNTAFATGGNTITLTSSSGYKFGGVPTINHGSGSTEGNIYITGGHSTATFNIPAPALSVGDTVLTLLPASTIQANAPDGLRSYVNLYPEVVTNEGGTPRVTALSINGVTISPAQQYVNTGLSINGTSDETTDVTIAVQKDNTTSTIIAVDSDDSSNVRNNSVALVTSSPITDSGTEEITIQFTGNGSNTVSGNSYSTTIGITEITLTANPNSQGDVEFVNIRFTNSSS